MGAPRASSCLVTANELGTGVQLKCYGLDPEHGLVGVDAVLVVSGCQLIVVEKSQLAAAVAAGSAAHAGIALMHRAGPPPDDIGANSYRLDQEFKLDSSWELVRS